MSEAGGRLLILDGGMGGELIRRGAASPKGLWSAKALIDAPDEVVAAHRAFIDAGARQITTNSYSSIPSYLGKRGMAHRCGELTALAGALARRAADAGPQPVRVAGGLPPLSESYRADLAVPDDEARPIYREMAQALAPHVDLFLCETLSCVRESRNALEAAREAGAARGLPVALSWTLNEAPGAGLRGGESIEEAFEAVRDLAPDAYLFNCTHPAAIERGLEILRDRTDRPLGGYPNRFEVPAGWTLDNDIAVEIRAGYGPRAFVESARRCVARGASMFGGCCGVVPEDIAALARAFA